MTVIKYSARETILLLTLFGFERKPSSIDDISALSTIDKNRLKRLEIKYQKGNTVFVADVAMKSKDLSPANVVVNYLKEKHSIKAFKIHGLNAFSISWQAMKLLNGQQYKKLLIIASEFYWDCYQDIWYSLQFEHIGKLCGIDDDSEVPLESQRAWRDNTIKYLVFLASVNTLGHWFAMKIADHITKKHLKKGRAFDGHMTH